MRRAVPGRPPLYLRFSGKREFGPLDAALHPTGADLNRVKTQGARLLPAGRQRQGERNLRHTIQMGISGSFDGLRRTRIKGNELLKNHIALRASLCPAARSLFIKKLPDDCYQRKKFGRFCQSAHTGSPLSAPDDLGFEWQLPKRNPDDLKCANMEVLDRPSQCHADRRPDSGLPYKAVLFTVCICFTDKYLLGDA